MKNFSCLLTFALMIGCGGADQAPITPEKEAELNTQMDSDMKQMTGDLNKMPGSPGAEAEATK